MFISEIGSTDITTSRWDHEQWHTTSKEITGSKPSAQGRRTDEEAKTWCHVGNRIQLVRWHGHLMFAKVNPSVCFVPQFSVQKMGMMAVPLSQTCSEDMSLEPMRCCNMKQASCKKDPPPVAQLPNTWESKFVLAGSRERDGYCLYLTSGNKGSW